MEVTINVFWTTIIVLFVVPFFSTLFLKEKGGYGIPSSHELIISSLFFVCWSTAIGLLIGRYVF